MDIPEERRLATERVDRFKRRYREAGEGFPPLEIAIVWARALHEVPLDRALLRSIADGAAARRDEFDIAFFTFCNEMERFCRVQSEGSYEFQPCGPSCVRSGRGFTVERVGRFELLYSENERRMRIGLDPGADALIVEISRANAWESPHEAEPIEERHRQTIREDIAAALRYMRVGHELE